MHIQQYTSTKKTDQRNSNEKLLYPKIEGSQQSQIRKIARAADDNHDVECDNLYRMRRETLQIGSEGDKKGE